MSYSLLSASLKELSIHFVRVEGLIYLKEFTERLQGSKSGQDISIHLRASVSIILIFFYNSPCHKFICEKRIGHEPSTQSVQGHSGTSVFTLVDRSPLYSALK